MTAEGFGPAVLDESSSSYGAIRGQEQRLIDANGGSQYSGGTSGNKYNGIYPKNPKRASYLDAAEQEFGK